MIEMQVSGIVLDPHSRSPIVVLRDPEERRALLIWIGAPEANAIMLVLEHIKLSRPATHDLLNNVLQAVAHPLTQVVINDMRDNTFFAQLYLKKPNPKSEDDFLILDSRPSDAIALALRAEVPIFVSENVMSSSSIPIDQSKDEEEAEAFRKFVEDLKPSDFNKASN